MRGCRIAALWLLCLAIVAVLPAPALAASPSISDPEVRHRLSEKLQRALSASRQIGKTRRADTDDLMVTGSRPQPAPKPEPEPGPKPKPTPPPPPKPDPIALIIERAARKAVRNTVQAALPAIVTPRWSYQGESGPEQWGRLRPDFASCALGERQSPIPLVGAIPVSGNPPLPRYRPSRFEVIDDGRNVSVRLDPRNLLRYGRMSMRLTEIRLHRPGEHWLGDKPPDMSVHLLHETDNGLALIVAISLMRGDQPNSALQSVIDAMPLEPGGTARALGRLNADEFLPPAGRRGYYEYDGSMTAPPCTEGIRWFVMTEPVSISQGQWATFATLFDANARPLQAVAGRRIKRTME